MKKILMPICILQLNVLLFLILAGSIQLFAQTNKSLQKVDSHFFIENS
jgi:hypothetical protein